MYTTYTGTRGHVTVPNHGWVGWVGPPFVQMGYMIHTCIISSFSLELRAKNVDEFKLVLQVGTGPSASGWPQYLIEQVPRWFYVYIYIYVQ